MNSPFRPRVGSLAAKAQIKVLAIIAMKTSSNYKPSAVITLPPTQRIEW